MGVVFLRDLKFLILDWSFEGTILIPRSWELCRRMCSVFWRVSDGREFVGSTVQGRYGHNDESKNLPPVRFVRAHSIFQCFIRGWISYLCVYKYVAGTAGSAPESPFGRPDSCKRRRGTRTWRRLMHNETNAGAPLLATGLVHSMERTNTRNPCASPRSFYGRYPLFTACCPLMV